jgi:hypothetical protein
MMSNQSKNQKKMKRNKLLFLLLIGPFCFGQITTAKVNPVAVKEFYRIQMAPEIRSASKTDFSNLRLYNDKNQEVPYLIEYNTQESSKEQFEDFSIVSRVITAKKSTSISVKNPYQKINKLTLLISNSDVTKKYNLSGSNDQKQWFGIVNNAQLSDLNNEDSTSVSKQISFPLCSYRYLKIDFDDTKTLPINIQQIGTTKNSFQPGSFMEVLAKDKITTQIPAEKKTLLKVTFPFAQDIDKVVFDIKQPTFFNRKTKIYALHSKNYKNKTDVTKETLAEFNLDSNSKNNYNVTISKSKELFIEIENEDNPTLTIESISFFQKPIYLIAQLSPNEKYTVQTGKENLTAPVYDLIYFEREIENIREEIQMTDIQNQNPTEKSLTKEPFWQQKGFMWLCIILAGITILFFSMRLTKDIKNNS